MNATRKGFAMLLLRWTVGVIVGAESALFAFSASTARHLSHMGLPPWMGLAIGIAELVAAFLFLLPASERAGGYALLAVFAIAILLHVLHGEYNIGPLAIYAAAVWAVLAEARNSASRVPV